MRIIKICRYYKEKGWFEPDHYYPVILNPFKKIDRQFFRHDSPSKYEE